MAKINNDKYYTPIATANHCLKKVCEVIPLNKISHIIEPSVGGGAFLHSDMCIPNVAYDIEPECDSNTTNIIKGDFLLANIQYLKGRLIVGNPPYGRCLALARKFFRKATQIADYIAFILPISQLHNNMFFYEFDLIYSEDLGKQMYSGRELHCCFNIYKRPLSGEINDKPLSELNDITIYRQDNKGYSDIKEDIRMCYWGNGSAGKILSEGESYSGEYKIVINNPKLKNQILNVFNTFNWKLYAQSIARCRIKHYHIVDVLRQYIPEIQ